MTDHYVVDIHEPGASAVRSVRIGRRPVRVGRGAICEVQLRGPGLAVIECTLRRTQTGWLLSPCGPKARVWVNGVAAAKTLALPESCSLTVGEVELRIEPRAAQDSATNPGSRETPLEVARNRSEAPPSRQPTARAATSIEPRRAVDRPSRETAPRAAAPPVTQFVNDWARACDRKPWEASGYPTASEPAVSQSQIAGKPRAVGTGESLRSNQAAQACTSPRDSNDSWPETEQLPAASGAEWLDRDELAARLAWERSDAAPPSVEPVERPGSVPLVEHDFDLPPLERLEAEHLSPPITRQPSCRREPVRVEPIEPSWPSARTILQSHTVHTAIAMRRQALSSTDEAGLTFAQKPAAYTFGNRAVFVLLLGVVAASGAVATVVAAKWCGDNRSAGEAASLLHSHRVSPRALAELAEQPALPWWATTREHLAAKAVALTRASDADGLEGIAGLLDRAAAISPFDDVVALARRSAGPSNESADASPVFQPAREVASLALAARLRMQRGQRDRAVELLRDGFHLAATADMNAAEPQLADTNSPSERVPLPNEELYLPLIEVMKEHDLWSRKVCEEIIPDWAPAWLAVVRGGRDVSPRQSEGLLEKLNELPAEPTDQGGNWVYTAALAEGLVLKGNLQGAAKHYERAIEQCGKLAWSGILWMSLADIEAQLYDTDAAAHARRMAQRAVSYGGPGSTVIKRMLRLAEETRRRPPRS